MRWRKRGRAVLTVIVVLCCAAGEARAGWVGVSYQPVTGRSWLGLEPGQGLQIVEIAPGGPADRAGLRPGDIVVSLDGEPLRLEAFAGRVAALPAGTELSLGVARPGVGPIDVRLELGEALPLRGAVAAQSPAPPAVSAAPAARSGSATLRTEGLRGVILYRTNHLIALLKEAELAHGRCERGHRPSCAKLGDLDRRVDRRSAALRELAAAIDLEPEARERLDAVLAFSATQDERRAAEADEPAGGAARDRDVPDSGAPRPTRSDERAAD